MIGKSGCAHTIDSSSRSSHARASSSRRRSRWTRTRSASCSAMDASPTSTTPSFSTGDSELALSLEMAFDGIELAHKGGSTTCSGIVPVVAAGRGSRIRSPRTLRELGLVGTRSTTKFVPEVYLINSSEVRLALLQGLLDTDGGPVTQGDAVPDPVHDHVSSAPRRRRVPRPVAGGVAYVGPARRRTHPGLANGRPVGYRSDAYVLDIHLPPRVEPFRLTREARPSRRSGGRTTDALRPPYRAGG